MRWGCVFFHFHLLASWFLFLHFFYFVHYVVDVDVVVIAVFSSNITLVHFAIPLCSAFSSTHKTVFSFVGLLVNFPTPRATHGECCISTLV